MGMHPEAARLFALDEALRAEAGAMLAASGIGAILAEHRYHRVGSAEMRTMTWRDLDYEREEEPSWERHWEVANRLAKTGWCVRVQCIDVYREQWSEFGLYLGIRATDPERKEKTPPGDPSVWKLDIWTARPEEFAPSVARRRAWAEAMTEEARSHVLALKEALCREPEYKKTLLSVHIYEAVLGRGITGMEEFRKWWREGRRVGGS